VLYLFRHDLQSYKPNNLVVLMLDRQEQQAIAAIGEATLKTVGADATMRILKFIINCQFFTSNTLTWAKLTALPPNPTLAAPPSILL
jgi:hypothetical protein